MTPAQALQTTLAGEHAAVYVYGVLGGRVSALGAARARDRPGDGATPRTGSGATSCTAMMRASGAEPVGAEVSYRLPNARSHRRPAPGRRAWSTEQRCADLYASRRQHVGGHTRRWAVDALADTAVRLLLRRRAEALPGVPEL